MSNTWFQSPYGDINSLFEGRITSKDWRGGEGRGGEGKLHESYMNCFCLFLIHVPFYLQHCAYKPSLEDLGI